MYVECLYEGQQTWYKFKSAETFDVEIVTRAIGFWISQSWKIVYARFDLFGVSHI